MHEHSHENRERTEAPLPDAHAVAALLPSWVYAEARAGRLRTVSPYAAAARSLSADGGAMARAAGVIA